MAQEIVPWIIGANALLSIAALVYSWLSSGNSKLQKQVDGLADTVEELEDEWSSKAEKRSDDIRREVREGFAELKEAVALTSARNTLVEKQVAVLESKVGELPNRDTTHRLELGLTSLVGEVATLAERIRPVAAVATRLQQQAEEGRR